MNSKGQSALEYLMTYGWALIVIAVVIGVLIIVTGGSTGNVVCQSRNAQLVMKDWAINKGTDTVGLALQNATGGTISSIEATSGGDFQADTNSLSGTITAGDNVVLGKLSGPSAAGSFDNGTIQINYVASSGLDTNVLVVCSGTVS